MPNPSWGRFLVPAALLSILPFFVSGADAGCGVPGTSDLSTLDTPFADCMCEIIGAKTDPLVRSPCMPLKLTAIKKLRCMKADGCLLVGDATVLKDLHKADSCLHPKANDPVYGPVIKRSDAEAAKDVKDAAAIMAPYVGCTAYNQSKMEVFVDGTKDLIKTKMRKKVTIWEEAIHAQQYLITKILVPLPKGPVTGGVDWDAFQLAEAGTTLYAEIQAQLLLISMIANFKKTATPAEKEAANEELALIFGALSDWVGKMCGLLDHVNPPAGSPAKALEDKYQGCKDAGLHALSHRNKTINR